MCESADLRNMDLEKRTSAAEAVERQIVYGTAKPVPFVKGVSFKAAGSAKD
jgi:hypothetical protein